MVSFQQIPTSLDSFPKIKASPIFSTFERTLQSTTDFIRGNPIVSTAAFGLGTTGLVAGATTLVRRKKTSKRKTKAKKRRKKGRRKTRRKKTRRTKKRGRRTPRTAGKGKDRSTKRIRYTKKGQPYVITRSGKAKFIKKTSARRSHRRKGGRY